MVTNPIELNPANGDLDHYPKAHNTPSTTSSLSREFSRVLKRSGIQIPHSLRHTFCNHLVMSGVDLTTVQRLAGHSTSKVTEQYGHLAPSHLEQSTSRLNL